MKKIGIFLLIAMMAFNACAYAKTGDVAGTYYSTNIHTILNGVEIDSINIGGKTLISAENMMYFGFNVYWDPERRVLEIYDVENAVNGAPPTVKKSNYPGGMPIGQYYETDILTYLDGNAITSYNVGGRTYISAEETEDFGYEVVWVEDDRCLYINNPSRAKLSYDIFLSKGEKPQSEGDGDGAFAIAYNNGKITAKGDAKLFNASLCHKGDNYIINTAFYQNEGLYYSSALQNAISPLACDGRVENPCDPSEKYDIVNQNVIFSVNGQRANKVKIIKGGGNGHVDFTFIAEDIPRFKENEVNEIYFSFGDTSSLSEYETEKPTDENSVINAKINSLKKNENDFTVTFYNAEKYIAVYFCESPYLGVVIDRLYILDKETLTFSDDILNMVRKIEGFNYDVIHPFAFSVKEDDDNIFFFSCASEEKTADFSLDVNKNTVVCIS